MFWKYDARWHYIMMTPISRSVRSDAQLSCTDTRFQKCSQSGKNGSKHPMLSISMACNVISCKKKMEETLKKSKLLILQCKFGSRAQKWPKNAKKTDHSIAIYSIFCICMVYFGCLQVNPHIQAVQNMCEKKEIGINNSMYLQFTEQYRMAKGLC
jgi:hypothetical protein